MQMTIKIRVTTYSTHYESGTILGTSHVVYVTDIWFFLRTGFDWGKGRRY